MSDTFEHPNYGTITGEKCYALSSPDVKYYWENYSFPAYMDKQDLMQEGALTILENKYTKWTFKNILRDIYAQCRGMGKNVNIDEYNPHYTIEKELLDKIACMQIFDEISESEFKEILYTYYIQFSGKYNKELSEKYNKSQKQIYRNIQGSINVLRKHYKSELSRYIPPPYPDDIYFEVQSNMWILRLKNKFKGAFKTIEEAIKKRDLLKAQEAA